MTGPFTLMAEHAAAAATCFPDMARLSAPPARLAAAAARTPALPDRRTARERGYSTRWDKVSRVHRQRNPLCRGCVAMGRVGAAEVTDHVIPHRGDEARFWSAANLQSACAWHHSVVKQRLEAMFDAGQVTADDLWLDSPVAVALARRLEAEAGGGSKL